MSGRRLVSIRRTVDTADRPEYDHAWERLRGEVEAGGAHAWRFAAAERPEEVIEFLEFASGSDPRGRPEVAALLSDLAAAHGARAEEWEELRGSS